MNRTGREMKMKKACRHSCIQNLSGPPCSAFHVLPYWHKDTNTLNSGIMHILNHMCFLNVLQISLLSAGHAANTNTYFKAAGIAELPVHHTKLGRNCSPKNSLPPPS
ncbi:hypothetical protein XENOCAPTIV_007089 [Xenoophorus captivus]|uniref:Uncharacterized protein n=1 Tax=Xenoophorus captivus TaxID=1517983 RepID=A0ABV0QQG4_9TELE